MISKATKPLEKKIASLNGQLPKLKNSQSFISRKRDDLASDYRKILQKNKQQKLDTKTVNQTSRQNTKTER